MTIGSYDIPAYSTISADNEAVWFPVQSEWIVPFSIEGLQRKGLVDSGSSNLMLPESDMQEIISIFNRNHTCYLNHQL
jgi:hypothetical protein